MSIYQYTIYTSYQLLYICDYLLSATLTADGQSFEEGSISY